MGSSLTLICNSRIFGSDISFSYLYWHDLYSAVLDIYFMISLYGYSMLDMISQLALVQRYPFQYSYICSSIMSVHLKGGGSTQDTRVLLINTNVVSGLTKCCWMLPFHAVCRGACRR